MLHATSLPVTDTDKKMSKKHLKATMRVEKAQAKLVKDKIKDHAKAIKDALKRSDQKSVAYNRQHMQHHQRELAQTTQAMRASESHLQRVKGLH